MRYTLATACSCVGWTFYDMAGPGTFWVRSIALDRIIFLHFPAANLPELRSFQSIDCAGWLHWLQAIPCWPGRPGLPSARRDGWVMLWISWQPDGAGDGALAIDQVLSGSWRGFSLSWWRWLGMARMSHEELEQRDSFIWKHGKDQVHLVRAGDSWQVSFLTQGRLMGPRQTVYEAVHRQAKFAAWDVMAKVISASHDEEKGVEVAVRAAQWMRRAESHSGSGRA